MSTEIVQVENGRVILALGRFQLGIRQNEELMRTIGAGQLVSVRRTFRESGSPAGSWAPLSPATVRRDPRKYGAGHKLLIDSGRLLNSISFAVFSGGVTIGTNLVYARVQQEGSADRAGAGVGPQARISGRSVRVGRSSYTFARHDEANDKFGTVDRKTSEGFKIKGRRRKLSSGLKIESRDVKAHQRFQNIPARPYLVIRPEDPARIRSTVVAYVNREARNAGLQAGGQP